MFECGIRHREVEKAVADPAIVLTPRHLGGIGVEVRAGNMMVNANFRASEAAEEAFRHVRASFAVRIGFAVVDALRQIPGMQHIPMRRFVGIDRAASLHARADRRKRGVL